MTTLGTTVRRAALGAAAVVALLGAAGCGDDDDSGDDAGGSVEAYCDAVAAIELSDEPPTVEQMEAIRAAAPDEIADDIDVVVDAFIEAIESGEPESVFEDEDVTDRLEDTIEPFEEENCPNNEE